MVGSTVDLGVGVRGDEVVERVFDISRATDSDRMGTGIAYGEEHAMGTGGQSRVGSYPLDPFDAVLDQYVFTLFYCSLILLTFVVLAIDGRRSCYVV